MAPFHVNDLSSYPTLFLGIGALLWIPLSLAIGRRPVFLFSTVTLFIGTIWAVLSPSFYHLLIAVCLQGFGAGTTLSAVSVGSLS